MNRTVDENRPTLVLIAQYNLSRPLSGLLFSFEGVSPVFLISKPPICDVAEVAIVQKDDLAKSGYRK